MKFAYKLQELRKGSGMSQEEFAELLGVSRQSVSKWESGKGYPEIDKLIFISNYFNTSLDLLLKDTSDYTNSNPSLSGSKSVRSSKKSKKKRTINLTKPQDINDFNNQSTYMSDPIPNKKKESYPLKRVSVSSNAQVRPIKQHRFGNSGKKINKKRLIGLIGVSACLNIAIASIFSIVGYNSSVDYYDDEVAIAETITATEIALAEDYDYYGVDWLDYGITWDTLYDDDLTSDFETQMISNINSQEETLLVDVDGKIYYTGLDVVATFSEAQYRMKNELNCMLLYQKYCSFQGYQNCNFMELYSVDLNQWIIINDAMLRVYAKQDYTLDTILISENDTYSFDDILNSDISEYSDWNNPPFEVVFRINKETKANVSSDILDLCMSAMGDRKINLSMKDYMSMYEDYNSKYELVNYGKGYNVTFVPKDFVIISVADLDE